MEMNKKYKNFISRLESIYIILNYVDISIFKLICVVNIRIYT